MLLVSRGRGVIFKSFIVKHPDLLRGSDFGSDTALYLLIYHQHISPKTIVSGRELLENEEIFHSNLLMCVCY